MFRKELILRRCAAANARLGKLYELNAPKPTVAGDCNGGTELTITLSQCHRSSSALRRTRVISAADRSYLD